MTRIPNRACEDAAAEEDEWSFFNAADSVVEGRGWSDVGRTFSRLPLRAKETVRERVWNLAQHSAGLHVSFKTSATRLRFEVDLLQSQLYMPHMPSTGVSGVDLYARDEVGAWRWVFAAQPGQQNYRATVSGLASGAREYRLYLPLYNGVEALRIGVPKGDSLEPAEASRQDPLVYYGTSIAQGACASRPGMAFVSQLGRRLDVPVINLGFSGNGRLEPELGDLIAEIDACAYVVDCLPNLAPTQTAERALPFFRGLRAQRPETPIVMVEDRTNTNAPWLPARALRHRENHAALRAAYDTLIAEEAKGFTYVADAPFLGEDGEGTVDGSHPTDLGMMRYADALE
ncbi:MAG: SGNH/GDSL hydrolase family protein, partial [Planctomycetota bacterium]